jgi:hypothetical protein
MARIEWDENRMINSDSLETIKSKVRKLLALSKSDNENEAAAALEKANGLIERYEIDEAALRFESVKVKATKTYVKWRTVIANAVSWLYGCHWYINANTGFYVFTGESLDAFMSSEMYSYLANAIERCAKKSIRKNAKFKFRHDFKFGMAAILSSRIMEMGEACSWSPRRNSKIEEARDIAIRNAELTEYSPRKAKKWKQAALARGAIHGSSVSLARQAGHTPTLQISRPAGAATQGELF